MKVCTEWSFWSFGSTGFEEVVEKRWMRDGFAKVRRLGISCSAIKRGEGGAELEEEEEEEDEGAGLEIWDL